MKDKIGLSKTISYALRHNPQEFGLTLDNEGWASAEDLLKSLKKGVSTGGLQ